jgi:hypothetical protein
MGEIGVAKVVAIYGREESLDELLEAVGKVTPEYFERTVRSRSGSGDSERGIPK